MRHFHLLQDLFRSYKANAIDGVGSSVILQSRSTILSLNNKT